MFSVVPPSRAYRGVMDQICSAILAGQLKVGDKLDRERELAQQFGVSRPTVREAVRILRHAGVLRVRRGPGGGLFVVRDTMPHDLLNTAISQGRRDIEDLFEARRAVEGQVVELAAKRASREDLEFLAQALQDFTSGPLNQMRFVAADTRFHLGIARAAKNVRLYKIMETLMKELVVAFEMIPSFPDAFELGKASLASVLDALTASDPIAARRAMESHHSHSYAAVDDYYTRDATT